ncbi:DMT family transporter [Pseudomonas sp. BMS12]|uniref:DMT family transporter n=1 Tax=Pseudomonas sp. BMS12 TaxID=1796033 RepID=UPI00083B7DEE|nr:DMT family transporter [Pseudomonas sp. BMS12]
MPTPQLFTLTLLTMLAFAGNSLLCRLALAQSAIDAASFTSIRLLAGALVLGLLVRARAAHGPRQGSWFSAAMLFLYAAGFSYAYLSLPTGTGALLLFGAVQATMLGWAMYRGERMQPLQLGGLALALAGLVGLLLPGLSAPPLFGSLLMLLAGVAWGVYSVRGKGASDPTAVTAGNFLLTVPFALGLSLLMYRDTSLDAAGVAYAIASGGITSGLGYALWYRVLPLLRATTAATIQLSVPVIAALAGAVFLDEAITLRLALASVAILGGIALVIQSKQKLGQR